MRRSKRIETLDQRPVNLDGYINEWPEMGFVAMTSPYDPKPSVKVANGRIVELDGKKREDFDFIDQFIADYAMNVERAEASMAVSSLEIARMIVDIHVSRKEILYRLQRTRQRELFVDLRRKRRLWELPDMHR